MSLAKRSCTLLVGAAFIASLCSLAACSTTNDAEEINPGEDVHYGSASNDDSGNADSKDSDDKGSGKKGSGKDSDKDADKDADKDDDSTYIEYSVPDSLELQYVNLFDEGDGKGGLDFTYIPTMVFQRGTINYTISSYYIARTEVTQALYKKVMDSLPDQDKLDDSLPVVNVSWYDAVLFCNALSNSLGLDTIYSYTSVGDENFLKDLQVDYSVEGIRLPTEMEWEMAAHGGIYETAYYWGSEPASKYAYYGQTSGPSKVAQFIANDFALYDMAGNVAEWVNDWYAGYSTVDEENPVGPETGKTKCVRGGGWTDKVARIAPKERDKKDPLYRGVTLGFRIAYTKGF